MTLSLSRRAAVSPLPLGSATTWDPAHGYLVHPHIDVAAAHVVRTPGARILSVSDDAGLTLAAEAAALEQARASL